MHDLHINRRRLLSQAGAFTSIATVLSSLSLNANAESQTMPSNIIEIVSFKLAKGADEAAFAESLEATNIFLKAQTGFVARRLSRNEQGTYFDHVEWATLDNAKAAMDSSMKQPELMPFLQMIDPSSMSMHHNALLISIG
jgi:hypothetical protein